MFKMGASSWEECHFEESQERVIMWVPHSSQGCDKVPTPEIQKLRSWRVSMELQFQWVALGGVMCAERMTQTPVLDKKKREC